MILKNPIVYVTIPLALALGLIWFRRKKVHCDTGGRKKSTRNCNNKKTIDSINSTSQLSNKDTFEQHHDLKHSTSMPIGSTPHKLSPSSINNNESFDFKFGKSAPIDITPHKTSPSRMKSGDKEPLNETEAKKEDIEYKTLNSIEENSLDSVDLPGSINCRRRFSFTIKTNEPPIVVKASTMITNSSPQSSFETDSTASPSNANRVQTSPKVNEKKVKIEQQALKISSASTERTNTKVSNHVLPISSPPLSLYSNKSNQSRDSGDSGKGSSPPNSEGEHQTMSSMVTYDFELPQKFVGYLVGKGGTTVQKIREGANVSILIRRHPLKPKKFKLCTLQGNQKQVDDALAIIKSRLPPRADLTRVEVDLDAAELLGSMANINSSLLQLNLIEGINNDVIISTVINGNHLFLQQPLHPSYPSLNILQNCMNQSYSSFESPLLPNYNVDSICVGLIDGHWYRLQIVDHQPDSTYCLAKYVDFGGYCRIQTTELRQIRTDFMTTPFQAIECVLSDIKPAGGEWSPEAAKAIIELTQYRTLQAQVTGYSEAGLPEIHLYSYLGPNNIAFINKELVARKYAEWCENVTEA